MCQLIFIYKAAKTILLFSFLPPYFIVNPNSFFLKLFTHTNYNMSRFTEHFDFDAHQLMCSQGLSSPSKVSFLSMSSSESTSSPRQHHQMVDPILTQSFSSFESNESCTKSQTAPSSPTSSFEEKPSSSGNKLKRFLTTISKKKRSMSSHS